MNKLDHVVTSNLNTNKDQSNESINNETMFDTNSFNLSRGTSNPLPVVTISLQVGKKHVSENVAGLTCLWDRRATNSMINRKHTKHYERKMSYNKVEYSTEDCVYCTTHYVKVPLFMPEFSSSKTINHCLHVDNYKGESVIGYNMIIIYDLMVQLGLTADFKHQVLQCDGATVHMKEPSSLQGRSNITKREMCEVVMQTADPYSTQEATEPMVKIIYSIYVKAELEQVANNTTQLNAG